MGDDFAELMADNKSIASAPVWKPDGESLTFLAQLDTDATAGSIALRGKTSRFQSERNVMFQVEYQPLIGRNIPLSRIDWRPFHTHNNKGRGPEELRFVPIRTSHIHLFDINWDAEAKKMIGKNLPLAYPLPTHPETGEEPDFNSVLALLVQEFRIYDGMNVPVPPWEAGLL